MLSATDVATANAIRLSQEAEDATALANGANSSQLHAFAQQAHSLAGATWSSTGVSTPKIALHIMKATTHGSTATALKSQGR